MAGSIIQWFLLVLSSCANLLLHPRNSSESMYPNTPKNHVALFIFGDSSFDVGNNNYLKNPVGRANYWPYGETFFNHPTGRDCDGRLIVDFIAEYLKLPLILPYLQPGDRQFTDGVNFASGGAGALVETNEGRVIDLKTQVAYLKNVKKQVRKQLTDEETKSLFSKAIYIFSIGGNDYATTSPAFKSFSKEDYAEIVIGNLTSAIKDIYKLGGRKFVILGLGSFDCSPSMRWLNKGSCDKEFKAKVELHNIKLYNNLVAIQDQLKEFQYVVFDFYTTMHERINNPSEFGFKEGKVACCGSGAFRGGYPTCGLEKGYELCQDVGDYIFFDCAHPTEKLYQQLAMLIWSGNHNVSRPYNLQQMVETETMNANE